MSNDRSLGRGGLCNLAIDAYSNAFISLKHMEGLKVNTVLEKNAMLNEALDPDSDYQIICVIYLNDDDDVTRELYLTTNEHQLEHLKHLARYSYGASVSIEVVTQWYNQVLNDILKEHARLQIDAIGGSVDG